MIIDSRMQDIAQEVRGSEQKSSSGDRRKTVVPGSNSGSTRKSSASESKGAVTEAKKKIISMLNPIDVHKAVEKLNKMAEAQKKDVSFSIDKDADATVIKVFKRKTGELIKQFPSEMILAMKAKFRRSTGWFYDSRM
jgi:flagellar protein FlaG